MTTGALDEFQTHRGRLFGIAYRMLGSVAEAEDVLQEAWLRWNGTTDTVREPAAYLATIVTRLCLTALDSARARRETYIGPWLPEPVDTAADPLLGAERAEALSLAVLMLLERLSPAERAAYVLHEAFAYPFEQIAEILETSAANARQLASRARTRITQERGRTVSPADRDRLLGAFVAAAQSGDIAALEAVLTADAVTFSDGGGVVSAARRPVMGREKVAAFLLGVLEKFASDLVPMPVLANGEPAFVGLRDGVPEALWSVDTTEQGVSRVLIVLNPQKLSQFAGLSGRSS